ncbi:ThiF family adenylyltransferase [Desulfonatronospira sp.]|uniref:HesA/MoeB/ThiF family protein n=1 Tax=Desulfonatronospira sp. TaxID=1962951 RepID=UPI0025C14269|nr:ThiF family adenylyltransferase [Desulfonatronospira sp.]
MPGLDFTQTLHSNSHFQDNYPFACISVPGLLQIAEECGLEPWQAQIQALENMICPQNYIRNYSTISLEMQLSLARSRVLLVGAGGLGGYVLELLARSGTGQIQVADGDVFEESNLNRQLLSDMHNLGKSKVDAALARVAGINPLVGLTSCSRYLTPEDLPDILPGVDLVIDCLGGVQFRQDLLQAAQTHERTLVTGFVAGNTGLACTVYPGDNSPAAFWQAEPDDGAEITLGNVAATVGIIAAMQTREAINILSGQSSCLRNRVFFAEMGACSFQFLEL